MDAVDDNTDPQEIQKESASPLLLYNAFTTHQRIPGLFVGVVS